MKTLKERIKECEAKTAEIMAANPEIKEVQYTLKNCSPLEIANIDKDSRQYGDTIRGLVSYANHTAVFAEGILI